MLSCEEFEILLADEIDGELSTPGRADDRAAFERHLTSCAGCAQMAEEAREAVNFMAITAAVEPPPELLTKILHATNSGWEFKLRARGVRGAINRFFAPVLQPRVVMGAMMTLVSLTMLSRCAGNPATRMGASDLDPVKLWTSLDDRTHRLWDRTLKSYESMRVVFEIRNQINDWKQQQAEAEAAAADTEAESRRLDDGGPKAGAGSQGRGTTESEKSEKQP